jgi:hypothetical protein
VGCGRIDYGDLPASDRDELRSLARSVRYHVANALPELIKAGEAMSKAQAKFSNHYRGTFAKWVTAEAGVSVAYAYRLIRISQVFGQSRPTDATSVSVKTAQAVGRSAKVAEQLKTRVANGEEITEEVARDVLQQHSPPKPAPQPLADAERAELAQLTAEGRQHQSGLWAVLKRIHDRKLYREFGTWEAYCLSEWEIGRRRSYQILEAARVVENVQFPAQIPPKRVDHALPLAVLPPEQQREAWSTAVATAPEGKVTGQHVAP